MYKYAHARKEITMLDLQKANMWKRISAGLCDLILLAMLAVGVAFLLAAITGFDGHFDTLESVKDSYEAKYNVSFDDMTTEKLQAMTEAERAPYEAAAEEFGRDEQANRAYSMLFNLTLIITTFSILISTLTCEFVVPLLFGNGQTLGKKVFGVGVMRADGVRITAPLLFARALLGKCTVELLVPVLSVVMIFFNAVPLMGLLAILGLTLAQLSLLISTPTRQLIHDKLAHTVTVDIASQRIFDTYEDLLAYKQRISAEAAEKKEY